MRYKPNITVTFTTANIEICQAWEQACQEVLGPDYEPMITSGLEGNHSLESGHFHGRSLDMHTKDIPRDKIDLLLVTVWAILGQKFYVDLEDKGEDNEHCHIQKNKTAM